MMSVQEKLENARRARREARNKGADRAHHRPSDGATDANGREITKGMWVKARKMKPSMGAWETIPVRDWEKKSLEEKSKYNVWYSNEHGNANPVKNHPRANTMRPTRVIRTLP